MNVKLTFNCLYYSILVNIEITGPDGKKIYKQQPAVKQDHSDENNIDKRKKKDNATDDFHYERFKKQFRRY